VFSFVEMHSGRLITLHRSQGMALAKKVRHADWVAVDEAAPHEKPFQWENITVSIHGPILVPFAEPYRRY